MVQRQALLLQRILDSRYFTNAVTLGRILRYVCEKTTDLDMSVKEYEIATEVLHRPQNFDPKLDPVVRVSMRSIRERLLAYFNNEGKSESIHLSIPKGHYHAEFSILDNTPARSDEALVSSLRAFWGPYLSGARGNLLLHTEPLFFRDHNGTYIRSLYVNDPLGGVQQITEHLGADPSAFEACFHYLAAGEVHCMFSLLRLFQDLGSNLKIANSRLANWSEIRHSNLILIGCTRTNQFMEVLREESDFIVMDEDIRNLSPRDGEESSYRGHRYRDGKLPRFSEYALITRRCGAAPGSAVTGIASNHGKAVEGAGNFLTLEGEISKLLARMGFKDLQILPERFQVLMRVDMIDLDDEVVNVEYVSHRVAD